jgi:hypothetical protein
VSIVNSRGEVVLNYSKVFIGDFGQAELLKPEPNPRDIGCDVNCTAGDSFDVCMISDAEGEVRGWGDAVWDRYVPILCLSRSYPELV